MRLLAVALVAACGPGTADPYAFADAGCVGVTPDMTHSRETRDALLRTVRLELFEDAARTERTSDTTAVWTGDRLDHTEEVLFEDGVAAATRTSVYTRDAAGRVLAVETTLAGDPDLVGPASSTRRTTRYEGDLAVLEQVDEGADGTIEESTAIAYDAEGRRLHATETHLDGTTAVIAWEYPDPARLDHSETTDWSADGTVEYTAVRTYDGDRLVEEQRAEEILGSRYTRTWTWEDGRVRELTQASEEGAMILRYDWTDRGLPASTVQEDDGDGDGVFERSTERRTTWTCTGIVADQAPLPE